MINGLLDFDGMCEAAGLEEVNGELASAILDEAVSLTGDARAELQDADPALSRGFSGSAFAAPVSALIDAPIMRLDTSGS